jgi:hypothetical protein
VNWPRESSTQISPGMNGTDYGHIDHWYWNKPATSPTQAPQPTTAPVPGTASANAYRITHYRAAGKIRGNALPRQQVIRDARRAAAGPECRWHHRPQPPAHG